MIGYDFETKKVFFDTGLNGKQIIAVNSLIKQAKKTYDVDILPEVATKMVETLVKEKVVSYKGLVITGE